MTPTEFSNVVTIDCTPEEVFAFLSQFENLPRWNYAITQTRRLGAGPLAVGVRYAQTRSLPTPGEETFEVTELEPGRRIAIRGMLGPFRSQSVYELRSERGSTVLTNSMTLEPTGVRSWMAQLAAPRIRSAVADNLRVLKEILEAGGSQDDR